MLRVRVRVRVSVRVKIKVRDSSSIYPIAGLQSAFYPLPCVNNINQPCAVPTHIFDQPIISGYPKNQPHPTRKTMAKVIKNLTTEFILLFL